MKAWRPETRSTMRSTKYLLESITGSIAVWSGLSVGTGHSANSSPAGGVGLAYYLHVAVGLLERWSAGRQP